MLRRVRRVPRSGESGVCRYPAGPAGGSAAALSVVASATRSGFETAIPLARAYATFEVRALNAAGRVLGTSKPFAAGA